MRSKLAQIQRELIAPKNQTNSFGKYKYRSCEDILTAVKKILPEGVTVSLSDEMVVIGNRYYVKAAAMISDEKETLTAYGYAREAEEKKGMDEAQITGAASSYARKYALNGLFAIDDSKDHDTDEYKKETTAKAKEAKQAEDDSKRKAAVDWVDSYMKQIVNCKDDRDLINLQTEGANSKVLKSLESKYPDLFKKVDDLTKEQRSSYANK